MLMMDKFRKHNIEINLYALAFGLALFIRLLRLGELPLGDAEAKLALQALEWASGLRPVITSQPVYVIFTGFIFFVMQSSNFAARLIPALSGSLIVLLPYQFRDRLGNKTALILSFLLVFDPAFLFFSRQAGGIIIAVGALLFAWGAWRNQHYRLAGVLLGTALLGGPIFWPGLIGLAVGYGLLRGLFVGHLHNDANPIQFARVEKKAWLSLAGYAIAAYILLGSFFLMFTGGLSAGFSSIPAYFGGWLQYSGVPVVRLLQSLIFYELMALLFAIFSLIRGIVQRDELTVTLGLWLFSALLLALVYPSRQTEDLIWVVIPLLVLAAREISEHLTFAIDGVLETSGMAIFTMVLLVFVFLNYSALAMVSVDEVTMQLRLGMLFGAIGLLIISVIMVAMGWSIATAVQGACWGLLAVFSVYTFANSVAVGGLRTYRTYELWSSDANISQVTPLIKQLNEISRWSKGKNTSLQVTVAGVDSPALLWALRDWSVTRSSDEKFAGNVPDVVIAPLESANTDLQSGYRGQDFSWRVYPEWELGVPLEWLQWGYLHEFSVNPEMLIVWVRNDLFLDIQNSQQ